MDYISLLILNANVDRLLNLSFLKFESFYREKCLVMMVAKYHHCKIIISESGLVRFKGSIHYLFNSLSNINSPKNKFRKYDKGFNGNSFHYHEVLSTISHLENLFNVPRSLMKIQSFEFGFNLPLKFSPNNFINGLLFHKGKEFEFRYKRNFSIVPHENYSIKIYNKGKQLGLDENLIRVELKVSKMVEVKEIAFETMDDFNYKNYLLLCKHFLKRFSEITYFDNTIDYSKLDKKEIEWISQYKNSQFWIKELKSNHRDRHKKRLQLIIQNKSKNLFRIIEKSLILKM